MGGLRKAGEQFEGLLGGAMLLGDQDAFSLLDDGAGFHRAAHILGQGGGGLVEVGVGNGHGRVPAEGLGQVDGVGVEGPNPQHLAWTALGEFTIAIWPAFTARRAPPRSLILGTRGSVAATALFTVLLGWLVIQAHGGSDVGLAERLACSVQIWWPFVVAVALRHAAPAGAGG